MRLRTISALLAGAMVAAVFISSQSAHEQLAMEATINRSTGAEVFKLQAVIRARIDVQVTTLPAMHIPSKVREILTVPFVEKERMG
jgi:hypothetical protein